VDARQHAAIVHHADDDRHRDRDVACETDARRRDRGHLLAAERDEHDAEDVDHHDRAERAEVVHGGLRGERRQHPQHGRGGLVVAVRRAGHVDQHDVQHREDDRADPEHMLRGRIAADQQRERDRTERCERAERVKHAAALQVALVERGRGGRGRCGRALRRGAPGARMHVGGARRRGERARARGLGGACQRRVGLYFAGHATIVACPRAWLNIPVRPDLHRCVARHRPHR